MLSVPFENGKNSTNFQTMKMKTMTSTEPEMFVRSNFKCNSLRKAMPLLFVSVVHLSHPNDLYIVFWIWFLVCSVQRQCCSQSVSVCAIACVFGCCCCCCFCFSSCYSSSSFFCSASVFHFAPHFQWHIYSNMGFNISFATSCLIPVVLVDALFRNREYEEMRMNEHKRTRASSTIAFEDLNENDAT